MFHLTNAPGLILPLTPRVGTAPGGEEAILGLGKPRLERAIGVIYRPESELASRTGSSRGWRGRRLEPDRFRRSGS